jgi:hypothetical protein
MRNHIFPVVLLTSLASGCVSMKASLAERASVDLGCPVKETEITEIVSGQYGVVACGCRATYVSYPGWTLNAVSGEKCGAQGPAKPVPPVK